MGTFLFEEIIFGPINSRRLGVSLGINLLPTNKKICTFDCIYCECGFNAEGKNIKSKLPSRSLVAESLKHKLEEMKTQNLVPDVITFAGNGEPTLHPDFEDIINDTIKIRNKYCPEARIAVLSNATLLHKESVVNALLKIEDNIQKLDGGLIDLIKIIDQPNESFSLNKVVEQLKNFKGQLIIQTMFVKGSYGGKQFDNTSDENIEAWLKLVQQINPKQVMLYSIDRDTPASGLIKIDKAEMDIIAKKVNELGIDTQVSG